VDRERSYLASSTSFFENQRAWSWGRTPRSSSHSSGLDFAAAIEALPIRSCVVDGEAIVCDDGGLAVFDLIRGHGTNARAILCAFDLLEVNGEDIRREPIEDRKRRLAGLLRLPHDGIALNEAFTGDGAVIYKHACALGCEGIVSKRLGSPYRAGRSAHWLKIKNPDAPAVRRLEEDWH
jgi:ATP-dependent DNA ligase